jgi:3-hydroxybutyryl-CoA dehydrogenase
MNGPIAVIGAGVIGCGVAQILATARFKVILVDESLEKASASKNRILRDLYYSRLHSKGEPPKAIADRIIPSPLEAIRDAIFVVENVSEIWERKLEVYQALDGICNAETLFAANTSAFPITKLAAATTRPERVIGVHFMNPVPLKPVVELIRGERTSSATVKATQALLERLGKRWVIVKDVPGFVTNRVLMIMINESIRLVEQRAATPENVDMLFRECFSHEMGPLETADLIGLDTILNTLQVLQDEYGDSKYQASPLLQEKVRRGELGRKTGFGFFSYD